MSQPRGAAQMTLPPAKFPPRSVLFLSTEVFPYAKTGGLADVSSALPQELRMLGHDVRVLMPKYGFIGEKKQKIHLINRLQGVDFKIGDKYCVANIKSSAILTQKTRIQMYMLESEEYFQRMGIYLDPETGKDYPDNDERFLMYALSAIELCKRLMWKPDIIHCNDWQSGLVPALMKLIYKDDPFFEGTKTVFTIHNLAYQGNFPETTFPKLALPPEAFSPQGLEFFGRVSYLKAGIAYADAIATVSETYSEEIRTPEFGCGMEGILAKRKKDLYGILNGIDLLVWDPLKDVNIVRPFSVDDLSGKEECKKDLCFAMGIPYKEDQPVLGMIARLSDQKGFDLVAECMEPLIKSGAQFVLLGEGEKRYEDLFRKLQKKHPDQIGVHFGFHDNFAHKIEAGSDIYLMPSAYEPCGLNQMYSMHYGTIPVVRKTGGLADTVIDVEDGTKRLPATGFTFEKYDAKAFWKALERALHAYYKDKKLWRTLQANGMKQDFSWDASAIRYAEVYEKILCPSKKT
ncbi:MAG: glycogen synthase GlgA [Bacteroidota bacterium]|nr:glycogen synthase GlgA [Bacteroidota bacterium]MDP4233301.1 glycogen synthase GlgA [Bacteroidota bacterium]MDP4242079.1 glycogen synthase GlgA [Bacteroidota bacterium]MDP4288642.1 glycogen synthase GlgA [Bacteroidota bacterium]